MVNLTSSYDPSHATLAVRVIRSFEYRTIRTHVFRDIDLTATTVTQLIQKVEQIAKTAPGFRPYRTMVFNAAKVYHRAHQTKSQNLSINLENDDDPRWLLGYPGSEDHKLLDLGVENETEISIFNYNDYLLFKSEPIQKWD